MTVRLEYEISAVGQDRLKRIFRGIEADAKATTRTMDRDVARSRRSVATGRGGPDRVARDQARAAAALDRQRSAALYRQHQLESRLANRNEAAKLQAIRREEQERIRTARRVEAETARNRRREEAARTRLAATRGRERVGTARTLLGAAGRGAGGAVGTLAAGAGIAAGVFGGMAAGNALGEEIRIRASASNLANQAGDPSLKGQLAAESKNVKGFTGGEVLAGMEEFVTKTGDLDMARRIIGNLGTVALATGTQLGDLGATAGQAFNVIRDHVKDPIQQVKELESLIGTLAQQGAMGAVEIRDLAQDFGKLGAATRSFEGGAPGLLRTMGAFAQLAVARGGAESSADASTAATRLAADIVTNREKFKKLGVDTKSKTDPTKLRDPTEIMADVLEKTGGDIEKTSGLFRMESGKIFKGLAPVYAEAEKKKKGSGRAAIMAEVSRYSTATRSKEEFQSAADSRMADEDIRLKEVVKRFNSEVGTRLIPALTQAIPHFERLIPVFADLTTKLVGFGQWIAENPWKGLGLLVGGAVVKEIAVAGLGLAVRSAITALIGGGTVAAAGSAATGAAAAGTAGVVGTGAAAAAKAGALALGGAGLAATAGLAAAGYQAHGLTKDIRRTGGLGETWDLLTKGPAKPVSGEDYDRRYGTQKPDQPGGGKADMSGQKLEESAAKAGAIIGDAVVAKLAAVPAMVAPNRSNPVIAR